MRYSRPPEITRDLRDLLRRRERIATVAGGAGSTGGSSGGPWQPLDSDLSAIAALTTTPYGRGFLALVDAAAGRTYIGAAALVHTHAESDVTGLVADLAGKQPLDSDLTAIAALATTAYGRSLLEAADAAAARALIGTVIGTDVQAHDGDLDSLAALTTAAYGRSLLETTSATAARTLLALGSSATTDKDNDGTLAANSDAVVPSQKAAKTYIDTADGLLIPKSLVDAKGDIVGASADNTPVRHAPGLDGVPLRYDSAASDGLSSTAVDMSSFFQPPYHGVDGDLVASQFNLWYELIWIPERKSITGLYIIVGSVTAGNVRSAIYNLDGATRRGTSATIALGAAGAVQPLAFAAAPTLAPGAYWVAVISDSTTARLVSNKTLRPTGSAVQANIAAPTTIAPPTAPVNTDVPLLSTY